MARIDISSILDGQPTRVSEIHVSKHPSGWLSEEDDGVTCFYGPWPESFGCWIYCNGEVVREDTIPEWEFLDQDGQFRREVYSRRFRRHGRLGEKRRDYYSQHSCSLFEEYVSKIPIKQRLLATQFKRYQWLVLALISEVPGFSEYVLQALENGDQQFLFAAISLSNVTTFNNEERRKFAKSMMSTRRHDFLSSYIKADLSRSDIRLLKKVEGGLLAAGVYRQLFDMVEDNAFSKSFRHCSQINTGGLYALQRLPKGMATNGMIQLAFSEPEWFTEFLLSLSIEEAYGFQTVVRSFAGLEERLQHRVVSSLATVRTIGELVSFGFKWQCRLAESIGFPKAPFPAISDLIPLATPRALIQEGEEMYNCVARYMGDVLAGRAYFYHWDGLTPATVMIEKGIGGRWAVSEALGYSNRALPSDAIKLIVDCVDGQPHLA